jgi:hypothetical protein
MKKILSAVLLFTIALIACKKESVVTYSSNTLVTGLWTGKYSAGSGININWTAELKPDGNCNVWESKIADTSLSVKMIGLYNISDGNLKIFARSAGSIQVKFDGTLSNNSLQGSIVWNYIANGIPATSAGIGNLVKQ